MQGYLVAETDERGKVEWVWLHQTHRRTPKPVTKGQLKISDLKGLPVHGASHQAVIDWLVPDHKDLQDASR
ncbi:MAG: hypothetical protein AAF382_13855 [Pseudomonadota bacterium]